MMANFEAFGIAEEVAHGHPFPRIVDDGIAFSPADELFLEGLEVTEDQPASFLYFDPDRTVQLVQHINASPPIQLMLPEYITDRIPAGSVLTVNILKTAIVEEAMRTSGRVGNELHEQRSGELVAPNTQDQYGRLIMGYAGVNYEPAFTALREARPELFPIAMHGYVHDTATGMFMPLRISLGAGLLLD